MTEYGPGGGKNTHTAFCILSSNAYNELAYVIIWIWLLLVFVVSALNVLCILAIALTPPLRIAFVSRGLDKASKVSNQFILPQGACTSYFPFAEIHCQNTGG